MREEQHGVEYVLKRNQFYRDNYRDLVLVIVLMAWVILFLCGFVYYQRTTVPTSKYFATTPDGRVIQVVRLTEAYQSTEFVLAWFSSVVPAIYSLDYVTYRQSLQNAQTYFTIKGHADFLKALEDSTNINAIKARKQVVSAEVTGLPVVLRAGQVQSNLPYSWDIKMPLSVTYQNSANEILIQKGSVLARIERVSTLYYDYGIAIAQLIFQAE